MRIVSALRERRKSGAHEESASREQHGWRFLTASCGTTYYVSRTSQLLPTSTAQRLLLPLFALMAEVHRIAIRHRDGRTRTRARLRRAGSRRTVRGCRDALLSVHTRLRS